MKRCIPLVMSCFCSFTPMYAQNDSVAIHAYAEQLKRLKLSPLFADYYYERKINLSKAAALKKSGVNLHTLEKQGAPSSYKEWGLFADAAVVGTVITKTDNPDPKAHYHTTYKILVEDRIKGDNLADTLVIRLVSGMIENKYVADPDEPKLEIGQQKLFFLNYIKFDKMETAQKSGVLSEVVDLVRMRRTSPYYISSDFLITSGYVLQNNKKTDRVKKAIETVKKINRINQLN